MKNKIYHSWVLKIDCDQVKNILSDFPHLYNMATSKSQWGHKSLWKSLHHATSVTTGNCFPLLLFLSLQRLTEFLLSAIVINSNLVNFTHKCYRLRYSNVETCLFQIHIESSHFFKHFVVDFQDQEGYSKVRTNSAVHIRVYKKPISKVDSERTCPTWIPTFGNQEVTLFHQWVFFPPK